MKRVNIQAILRDPVQKRELIVGVIMAMQEHEGRDANRNLAEEIYDKRGHVGD